MLWLGPLIVDHTSHGIGFLNIIHKISGHFDAFSTILALYIMRMIVFINICCMQLYPIGDISTWCNKFVTKCEQQNETGSEIYTHLIDLVLNVAKQWIGLYIVHVLNYWYICDIYQFLFEWPPHVPPTSPPHVPPPRLSCCSIFSRTLHCIFWNEIKRKETSYTIVYRKLKCSDNK